MKHVLSGRRAKLDHPTLELRRLCIDLKFCYKIDEFFTFSTVTHIRDRKLRKSRCSRHVRKTLSPTCPQPQRTGCTMHLRSFATCMTARRIVRRLQPVMYKKYHTLNKTLLSAMCYFDLLFF